MQKIASLFVVPLLAIFLTLGDASMRLIANAATTAYTQPQAAWETYTFTGEEFSVALPEMPALDHTSRNVVGEKWDEKARRYGAYGDGVVYLIHAYDKPRNGEDITHFAQYCMKSYVYSGRTLKLQLARAIRLDKFHGKQYTIIDDTNPPSYPESSIQVFLTEKHAYALRAFGGNDTHPGVQRFFNSFELTDKPAGRQIVDESILPLPLVVRASDVPASKTESVSPGENKEPGNAGGDGGTTAMSGDNSNATEPTYKASEVTRKAAIVSKPEPHYTKEARRDQVTGTVRLRILLSASGKVTHIIALTLLPHGLTENAILAASHIKFLPAMKGVDRVSQYVQIEYNFNIY